VFEGDDIPEALRESPASKSSNRAARRPIRLIGYVILGAIIALVGGMWSAWQLQGIGQTEAPLAVVAPAQMGIQDALVDLGIQFPDTLLGHRPYEEAPDDSLVAITSDGSIEMRAAAADAFLDMVNAARREDVYLVPLSGFRSIEYQRYLFFGIKAEAGQATTERAETSAPPGYSEHHTGYAVDIGDATRSETDVETSFERTSAFRWLEDNAGRYNFELSFPKDNPYGVSYEPWHWRFVGDTDSLETFYRQQPQASSRTSRPE
jgi:D-alanyl-D-alanine carboxypeptidase